MKIIPQKNESDLYSKIILLLIGVLIIVLPLSFIRIDIYTFSLSIVSVLGIIICCAISLLYFRQIYHHFNRCRAWTYAFFFIISFLPSLFLHTSIHAIGVYVEWILMPFFTTLCISTYIHQQKHMMHCLYKMLFCACLSLLMVAVVYILSDSFTYDGRLNAFYDSPNQLAMYLTPLFIMILGYIASMKKSHQVLMMSFVILNLTILTMTRSFNAFFALFLSFCTTFILFTERKKIAILLIPITILCILIFGYAKYLTSESQLSHNSFGSRVAIWRSTVFSIQRSPLIGYEIDSFQEKYLDSQRFFPPFPEWAVPTPHNIFFTLFFSGGFFSVLFFTLMITKIQTDLYLQYKQTAHRFLIFQFVAMCSFFFIGIFDTPFWKIDLSYIFWLNIVFSYFILHHPDFLERGSKQVLG